MIIVLTGADHFRKRQRLTVLRDAFVQKFNTADSAIADLSCDVASIGEIKQALTAGDLFSTKKCVVLRDPFALAETDQETLAHALGSLSDDVICLVALDAMPAKKSTLKEALQLAQKTETFAPLTAFEAKAFVEKEATRWGASIEDAAARDLANALHADTWQLALTVKSLAFMAQEKNPAIITKTVVDEILQNNETPENFFALTDAVSSKNIQAIAKELHAHVSGGAAVQLLTTILFRHFVLLRMFALSPNATLPGVHEFVAKKAKEGGAKFTVEQLEYAMNELAHIDADSKTGKLPDPESRFLLLFATLCTPE